MANGDLVVSYSQKRKSQRLFIVVVSLQNVRQMFVISRPFQVLPLVVRFFTFQRSRFLRSMILHRAYALFFEILVDLLIVHRIYGNGSPQFLKFIVYRELCCLVVIEYDLLLVQWTQYEYYFVLEALQIWFSKNM